jgi:hypothetical protein
LNVEGLNVEGLKLRPDLFSCTCNLLSPPTYEPFPKLQPATCNLQPAFPANLQPNKVGYAQEPNFSAFSNSLPPQNVDAEESILGGILLDPEAIGRVADLLVPRSLLHQ